MFWIACFVQGSNHVHSSFCASPFLDFCDSVDLGVPTQPKAMAAVRHCISPVPAKRQARDKLWYTKEEFVHWYGQWRGQVYWDGAGLPTNLAEEPAICVSPVPAKRQAWDGLWYTKEEFVHWYDRWHGQVYWDGAGLVRIRFMLLSGKAVCPDLIVPSSSRPSAWDVRFHLRTFSEQDDVHKVDYDS